MDCFYKNQFLSLLIPTKWFLCEKMSSLSFWWSLFTGGRSNEFILFLSMAFLQYETKDCLIFCDISFFHSPCWSISCLILYVCILRLMLSLAYWSGLLLLHQRSHIFFYFISPRLSFVVKKVLLLAYNFEILYFAILKMCPNCVIF